MRAAPKSAPKSALKSAPKSAPSKANYGPFKSQPSLRPSARPSARPTEPTRPTRPTGPSRPPARPTTPPTPPAEEATWESDWDAGWAEPPSSWEPYEPNEPNEPNEPGEVEPVSWVSVPGESLLVTQGYHETGPAVLHDPGIQTLLSDSNSLLYELAGDELFNQITYQHDHDWSLFPEIGHSLKQLGYGEVAICLAICPNIALWAVGMAGQQRKRMQAARLALCVAFAATGQAPEIVSRSPDFMQLCQRADVSMEGLPAASSGRKWKKANAKENGHSEEWNEDWKNGKENWKDRKKEKKEEWKKEWKEEWKEKDWKEDWKKDWKKDWNDWKERAEGPEAEADAIDAEIEAAAAAAARDAEAAPAAPAEPEAEAEMPEPEAVPEPAPKRPRMEKPIPRDSPLWLFVENPPKELEGYILETLVMASNGGKRRSLYAQADGALQAVLGSAASEVTCRDADASACPEVGSALKLLGDKEEPFTLAMSPTRSLCGIGVAATRQVRSRAAKLSLTTLIALQMAENGEDIPDLSEATEVADFLEEARVAKDALLHS
ncbi:unnamed protein product [Effrenium voratum]|nr:unnamed protein product [Effrenium voratum]